MPYTKKAKTMTKSQLVEEMNRMAKELHELRGEAAQGIDSINASLRANADAIEGGFALGHIAQSLVAGLPLKEFATKATIGFIYGYTLGVAGNAIYTAMLLLAMPAWINFVCGVLISMAMIYIAFTTIVPISTFTYNGVAKLTTFVKREALAMREWVEETAHEIRMEVARREAANAVVQ